MLKLIVSRTMAFHWSNRSSLMTPKGEIRSRKSKDRQYNDQTKKKDKRTNNNLQNTTQKTRDRATSTPLNVGVNSCAPGSGRVSTSISTRGTVTIMDSQYKGNREQKMYEITF